MGISRREFLASMTAVGICLPMTGWTSVIGASPGVSRYFSARTSSDGRHYISGFDANGKVLFDTQLPSRGHGLSLNPVQQHLVASARRPGTYLMVVDATNGKVLHDLESGAERHFYGHSLFSNDGRWLYTSENNIQTGYGVIGVRDVQDDYKQVKEFSSHGIGPHEINMLSDGRTLVVANGGILTRPETGRTKLNLETMSPSLTYLDAHSGDFLEEHKLSQDMHKNSIRHFAVNANDQVCFAMQYQGSAKGLPPLIGMHRKGEKIQLFNAPDTIQKRMANYCGSVCPDTSGQWFAVSSPKGNLVTFWSARDGKYVGNAEVADGCGIAAGNEHGEFLLSSGQGGVYQYVINEKKPLKLLRTHDARWDNHISRLAL